MKAYALLASMVVVSLSAATPAAAQSLPEELRRFFGDRHEAYKEGRDGVREVLIRLHRECEAGDRRACVHFGMIVGENKEHREEWRREHPEFFSWFRL